MSKIPKFSGKMNTVDMEKIEELYTVFISEQTRPLSDLSSAFSNIFSNSRIVSFRKSMPKSLNVYGDAALKEAKIWVIWLFILHFSTQESPKQMVKVLKEGLQMVGNKDELVQGFEQLLEMSPQISFDEDDKSTLEKVLGRSSERKNNRELQAISLCGEFALVNVNPAQQKRLKSASVVIPVKNNPWVNDLKCSNRVTLDNLLQSANYAYYPVF